MYTLVIFPGMNNCGAVINFVAAERNVFYRERFARMYSSWAYSFSQVNNVSVKNGCCQLLRSRSYSKSLRDANNFLGSLYIIQIFNVLQVLVEVPYSLLQSVLYTIIVYPMIGYHMSVYKMFWSLYSIFCSLLIFNYCGMLMVALTPNVHMAVTLRSSFFSMLNLFAGFVIPKQVRLPLSLTSLLNTAKIQSMSWKL